MFGVIFEGYDRASLLGIHPFAITLGVLTNAIIMLNIISNKLCLLCYAVKIALYRFKEMYETYKRIYEKERKSYMIKYL